MRPGPRQEPPGGLRRQTLAPALRLGWLVAPPWLHADVMRRKRLTDLGCSPLPQAAFAGLLRSGGYDRHLRRTGLLYRRRRDALPDGMDDSVVHQRLAERGGYAPALSEYVRGAGGPGYPGLVLGYAALSADRLRAAVAETAETLT